MALRTKILACTYSLLSFCNNAFAQFDADLEGRFEIVGVISGANSVVLLQDKQLSKTIVRRLGESVDTHSESNRIAKISKDSIEIETGFGEVVVLEKDQFSSLVPTSTPTPTAKSQGEVEMDDEDFSAPEDVEPIRAHAPAAPGRGKYSKPMDDEQKETLRKLDDYYLNPDKYSPEEVYEMERKLFDEGEGPNQGP